MSDIKLEQLEVRLNNFENQFATDCDGLNLQLNSLQTDLVNLGQSLNNFEQNQRMTNYGLNNLINSLNGFLSQLEANMNEMNDKMDRLKEDYSMQFGVVESATNMIRQDWFRFRNGINEQYATLSRVVDDIDTELQSLGTKIYSVDGAYDRSISDLKSSFSSLSLKLDNYKKEYNKAVNTLTNKVNDFDDKIDENFRTTSDMLMDRQTHLMNKHIEDTNNLFNVIFNNKQEVDQNISAMERMTDFIASDCVNKINAGIADIDNKTSVSIEALRKLIDTKIDDFNSKVNTVKDAIDCINIKDYSSDIETIKEDIKKYKSDIETDLKDKDQTSNSNTIKVLEGISNLESAVNKYSTSVEDASIKIDELEKRLLTLFKNFTEFKSKVNNTDLPDIVSEIHTLANKINNKQ